MTYADRLHAQASAAADRILATAAAADPDHVTAKNLAITVVAAEVAGEVADAADCCHNDQLGFAVMLAAELATRVPR